MGRGRSKRMAGLASPGSGEGVGLVRAFSTKGAAPGEEMVPSIWGWVRSCHGPSTAWPTRRTDARKRKSATSVGMTEFREGDSKSKEKCDKVRNYESHIEEAGESDEQRAGDDTARGAAAAGCARGGSLTV